MRILKNAGSSGVDQAAASQVEEVTTGGYFVMLGQLVLGRAMMRVAHIDLASVAADRCARRGWHLRWIRRCIDIRAAFRRDGAALLLPPVVQRAPTRNRR